jgi:hypothetical protein
LISESIARQVVASVSSEIEASIIADALERADIRCWLSGGSVADSAIPLPRDVTIAVEHCNVSKAQNVIWCVEATRKQGTSDLASRHGLWSYVGEATKLSGLRFALVIYRKLQALAAIPRFRVAGILLLQFIVALGLFAWVGQREIVHVVMTLVVACLILTTIAVSVVWIVSDPSRVRHRFRQYSPFFVAVAALIIVLRFLYFVVS